MYCKLRCGCTERTEGDRVAEPVDSVVSSPGAYLALGLLYTVAALPAIVAPQAVCASDKLIQAQGPFAIDVEVTVTSILDLSLGNLCLKPHVPVLLDACLASDCMLVMLGVLCLAVCAKICQLWFSKTRCCCYAGCRLPVWVSTAA